MEARSETPTTLELPELLESIGVTINQQEPRAALGDKWVHIKSTIILGRECPGACLPSHKGGYPCNHVTGTFTTEFSQGLACIDWHKAQWPDCKNKDIMGMLGGFRLTLDAQLRAAQSALIRQPLITNALPCAWIPPTSADVISSCVLDASALDELFPEWAENFGYDSDSTKAKRLYEKCQEIGIGCKALFTASEWEAIREASQEY